jgi:hypothetical protein
VNRDGENGTEYAQAADVPHRPIDVDARDGHPPCAAQ